MRRLVVLVCVSILSLIVLTPNTSLALEKDSRDIKVLILDDVGKFKLAVHSSYEILNENEKGELLKGKWFSQRKVKVDSYLRLGRHRLNTDRIVVKASKDGRIFVNGKYYRGKIVISKNNKKLSVINVLDIEDYLKGVLFHEVSPDWPIEALKAQAVVARTFALYHSIINKKSDYDVKNDTSSQMYGGLFSERSKTNIAVDSTKKKILAFRKKIFLTYYHATCGGSLEDASVLWKIDIPCLKEKECGFCKGSPHFKWRRSIRLKEIKKKFRISDITDIEISSYTPSNRVNMLLMKSEAKELPISAKEFRHMLGSTVLRSTNFTVEINRGYAKFKGQGWGHGVGMCQWGAHFMSKKGNSFEDILTFYYPNAQIENIDSVKKIY